MNKKVIVVLLFLWSNIVIPQSLQDRMQFILNPNLPFQSRFYINSTFSFSSITGGFNCNSEKRSLGTFLFGCNLHLEDIYLASKLAAQNKFTLPCCPFGDVAEEQFIACLADSDLSFYCCDNRYDFAINFNYNFLLNYESFIHTEINLPITRHKRALDYTVSNGSIACTVPQSHMNNVSEFFLNYSSFETFMNKEVFGKKNLTYVPYQYAQNIGDLTLELYYHTIRDRCSYQYTLQPGISLIAPTGFQPNETILWGVSNSHGAFISSMYLFFGTQTPSNVFNLYGKLDLGIKFRHNRCLRIPQIKNNNDEVFFPDSLSAHTLLPFEELDSTVPLLADNIFNVTVNTASYNSITLGNIWANIFHKGIFLITEYQATFHETPTFTPTCCPSINKDIECSTINQCYPRNKQDIFVSLLVESKDRFSKAFIGYRTTIAGKNVPIIKSLEFGLETFF